MGPGGGGGQDAHPNVFFLTALMTSLTPRFICFFFAAFFVSFNTRFVSFSSASGTAITLTCTGLGPAAAASLAAIFSLAIAGTWLRYDAIWPLFWRRLL